MTGKTLHSLRDVSRLRRESPISPLVIGLLDLCHTKRVLLQPDRSKCAGEVWMGGPGDFEGDGFLFSWEGPGVIAGETRKCRVP